MHAQDRWDALTYAFRRIIAVVGIPPLRYVISNQMPSSGFGTLSGGEFDWGGRLRKCSGGAQRSSQDGWKLSIRVQRHKRA